MLPQLITATLLYVEDELLLHTVLETGLDDAGFRVVAVASGEEGLEVLRERPEILGLITDVNLGPGLDGGGGGAKGTGAEPDDPGDLCQRQGRPRLERPGRASKRNDRQALRGGAGRRRDGEPA